MYFPAEGARWSAVGLRWVWRRSRRVAVAAVVVVAAVKVHQYWQRQQRRKRWAEAGKDVVVLHMFSRGAACPNLSPFVLKLETYLRMTEIKYEVDYEEPQGSKGKSPWITLNGEDLADSQFIMDHLGTKFAKDLSAHLSGEEKAVAHAFRNTLESNFLFAYAYWRYVEDKGRALVSGMQVPIMLRFAFRAFLGNIKKMLWMQGMGRHTRTEVQHIGRQDLAALSAYLGEKDYLMGEKPTEVDCTVFGILCQVMYCSHGSPYLRMLESDFPNLRAYVLRVRDKFWPDWNACLDPPQPVP
ncbi:failed axon connections homolog [Eriocheir sinensis]|uniref:failed axon connections homolog n=1 Tax=Eriocheir sinensis TaxID=95602 RepID=UPI0021C8554A|nr:failed axon connections homolog [Eriocheir sinensis]XP_050691502.1 failed axon connections homolog [Eriocheir sinensis]